MSHTGTKRPFWGIDKNNDHADLPADYAVVPAFLTKLTGEHPKDSNYTLPSNSSINEIVKGHDEWVNSSMDMFNAEETETCVTWKLFFRNKAKNSDNDTLPYLYNSSIIPQKTVIMIPYLNWNLYNSSIIPRKTVIMIPYLNLESLQFFHYSTKNSDNDTLPYLESLQFFHYSTKNSDNDTLPYLESLQFFHYSTKKWQQRQWLNMQWTSYYLL